MSRQFRVRYVDRADQRVTEATQLALDEASLRAELLARGHIVLGLRALRPSGEARRVAARFDVPWWCRELRTLLVAGMTVVEALETMFEQSRDGPRREVNAELLRCLRQGQALSSAMRTSAAFPDVLVAGVTASERTSALQSALDDFLRYDELMQQLRRKAVSAAIYPLMVVSLGAAITVFLLVYVIPRFSLMYAGLRGDVSVWTRVLLVASGMLRDHQLALACVLLLVVAAAVALWRTGRLPALLFDGMDRVGPLRRQWDHFRCAKLFHALALMFKGGYTVDEALAVCANLGLGSRLTHGVSEARQALAQGRSLARAFEAAQLTDVTALRLLAVADRTGGFAAVLQTIADRHAQVFATFIERMSRLIEPVLMLLVALVVGGIVVMMYMPIFDIAAGIR